MRQPDVDVLELSDASVADQLAREPEVFVAPLLAAGLENALRVAHGLHEALALVNRQRQRLLAVNILARLERGEVHERVPVVRRAVDDNMHIIALEQLAEILVELRLGPSLLGLREVRVVHVAHGEHLAERRRLARYPPAPPAAADERDAEFVIGPERLGGGLRGLVEEPLRQRGRGSDSSGGLEEMATGVQDLHRVKWILAGSINQQTARRTKGKVCP